MSSDHSTSQKSAPAPLNPDLPPAWRGTRAAGGLAIGPVSQFEVGEQKNFVYIVHDWQTREAALVDPQADINTPIRWLLEQGLKLTRVLITHSHYDHIAGLEQLCSRFPGLPIHVDSQEKLRIKVPQWVWEPVFDGHPIAVGNLLINPIHTPGHSSGEICYHLPTPAPGYLLSGDTVFIRDCGRTDLPTGSNSAMFESLQKLKKLPPKTILLPGHHYASEVASTLEREWSTSPPFLAKTVQELAALE